MVDRLVNSSLNAQRINNVENCFGSSGQPLSVPGRVLVGEGVLTKMCRKKPKPRQFFLFNDILVYGNILINKKKYNKQHIIPLEEVKLENLEDDSVMTNGWLIRTPTKSFAVYAATATEKSEWMAHINKCLTDLLQKTGKKQSTQHAAVWIPDSDATRCMHCRKTQFNIINRRHHCRKCGAVVCGMCSSKKFLLPAQSSKPLRVCLSCYDTLSKSRTCISDDVGMDLAQQVVETKENEEVGKKSDESSDDSDDDEDEAMTPEEKKDAEDTCKDLEALTIEDKPTFYRDNVDSSVSCPAERTEVEEVSCPSQDSHYNHSETHVEAPTCESHSAADTSTYSSADTGTSDSGCGGGDSGRGDSGTTD